MLVETTYLQIKDNLTSKKHLTLKGLCENTTNYHVLVDSRGVDFGVAYVAKDSERLALATNNQQFLDEFFEQFQGQTKSISGIDEFIYSYLKERYELEWHSDCGFFAYDGTPYTLNYKNKIGFLKKEHWQLVSDGTFYKADQQEIFEAIDNRPTACIYDGDNPVCWCLVHTDNALGMLYTMPDYRHRGYALEVMTCICERLLEKNMVPHAYIVKGNVASEKLAQKYYLRYCYDAYYCGVNFSKKK